MKILVHFGTSKTGSTSIQTAMDNSRRELATNGVLYPDYGYNHHILSALFKQEHEISLRIRSRYGGYEKMKETAELAFAKLRKGATVPGVRLIVLSSETFFGFSEAEAIPKFVKRLQEISSNLEACVYIREPASRFLSSFQQGIKRELPGRRPEAMNVRPNIEQMSEAFGGNITVRPFVRELMEGGDVVADFAEHFLAGYGVKLKPPTKTNETLSAEVLDLLYWYKKILMPGRSSTPRPEFMDFQKTLNNVELGIGGGTRPKLLPAIRTAIIRASTDLIWLRDHYGIVFPDVDYSIIDGEIQPEMESCRTPQDIMEINWEKRNELMLRSLYEIQQQTNQQQNSFFSKIAAAFRR